MQGKCTLEPVLQNFAAELGTQATHWAFQLHTSLNDEFKIAYGLYSPALHTRPIHTISQG